MRYVPGTYTLIPARLIAYRTKFKVVGKNLFVLAAPAFSLEDDEAYEAVQKLLNTKTLLRSAVVEFGADATIGEVCQKLIGPTWVKATDAQRAEYTKAKLAFDTFCVQAKQKFAEQKKKAADAETGRAIRLLVSKGWKAIGPDGKESVLEPKVVKKKVK